MPVISKGRNRILLMTKNRQFFHVGQKFMYTPIADPSTTIIIEVVDREDVTKVGALCRNCALVKWCGEWKNRDENGINYIPVCQHWEREDEKEVYFRICQ